MEGVRSKKNQRNGREALQHGLVLLLIIIKYNIVIIIIIIIITYWQTIPEPSIPINFVNMG